MQKEEKPVSLQNGGRFPGTLPRTGTGKTEHADWQNIKE
jgi:hypothetical protein